MSCTSDPVFCCDYALPKPANDHGKLHNDPNRDLHHGMYRSFINFAVRRQVFAGISNVEHRKSTPDHNGALTLDDFDASAPEHSDASTPRNSGPLTPDASVASTPDHVGLLIAFSRSPREYLRSQWIPGGPNELFWARWNTLWNQLGLPEWLRHQPPFDPRMSDQEDSGKNPLTPDTPYCIVLASRLDFGPVLTHRYFMIPGDLEEDWIELTQKDWWEAGYPFSHPAERWDLKCEKDELFFRLTLRANKRKRGFKIEPFNPVLAKQNRSQVQRSNLPVSVIPTKFDTVTLDLDPGQGAPPMYTPYVPYAFPWYRWSDAVGEMYGYDGDEFAHIGHGQSDYFEQMSGYQGKLEPDADMPYPSNMAGAEYPEQVETFTASDMLLHGEQTSGLLGKMHDTLIV